jgi:iron complex transport system substrate-binding protein
MNKWWWLLSMFLCWIGAGFAISNARNSKIQSYTPLPKQPNRIVSLAPNLTEIIFALGLDTKIVGVTIDSDFPPIATKKIKVGTFWQPNIEAVIAAKPDLVITLKINQQINLAERLRRIGYTCLELKIEKVNDLFKAIVTIGDATGRQNEANNLVSDIQKKLYSLQQLFETSDRIKVLWVVQREPLRVAGRDTFVNEMIELAGGENAIGPTIHKYPPIGAEQVIACQADVIIEPAMSQDLPTQHQGALQYWSKFESIPAVANKRIYVIEPDTVSRLGPRLYEGVETITKCLTPELFSN